MKLSVVGLLVLGLFAALSAAVLMALLTRQPAQTMGLGVEPEVTVLVATHDLAPNTMIDSGAIGEQKVAKSKAPEQSLSTSVQAIGKVIAIPVIQGQAFRKDMFVTEGGGQALAATFAQGKLAVAISLSDAGALDGVLYPGSVVDIILTMKSQGSEDSGRSKTVLERIQVLAIERQTVIAKDAEKQDGGTGNRQNVRRVTLLVDSRQAQVVNLAMSLGTLSLAMRNPVDNNTADHGTISLSQLMPNKDSGGWLESIAKAMAKARLEGLAAQAAQPPAPTRAQPEETIPASPPQALFTPAPTPKPAWQTTVIHGAVIEKVEFPEEGEGKSPADSGTVKPSLVKKGN